MSVQCCCLWASPFTNLNLNWAEISQNQREAGGYRSTLQMSLRKVCFEISKVCRDSKRLLKCVDWMSSLKLKKNLFRDSTSAKKNNNIFFLERHHQWEKTKTKEQNKNKITPIYQSAQQLIVNTLGGVGGGIGGGWVRQEKGKGGEEGFGIALSQKGKCSSSSRVREGYRVKGRGTLQQLVSIIHGVTAECTGACVCMCVHVCKAEASQGEGWDQWRQEGCNRSERMKIIKILAGSWPWSCRCTVWVCVADTLCLPQCHRMWKSAHGASGRVFLHTSCEITFLVE